MGDKEASNKANESCKGSLQDDEGYDKEDGLVYGRMLCPENKKQNEMEENCEDKQTDLEDEWIMEDMVEGGVTKKIYINIYVQMLVLSSFNMQYHRTCRTRSISLAKNIIS